MDKESLDKASLLKFLVEAHKHTFAAPSEVRKNYRCTKPILPGHKDYDFVDGDWRYHDSYAGSAWAPGREVVFYQGKPVWAMSYQGKVPDDLSEEFIEKVFAFLKKALMSIDSKLPFRGPEKFKEDDFEYSFLIKGDYAYFTGRESIKHKGREVFFQDVMGELIK